VSGTYSSTNFHIGADASGHVLVTYVAPIADILGGYAPEFAEPRWTRSSDLSAFHSWSALGSGDGTGLRGFGPHYENDGTVGGARDTWGVAVGWNGSTGHGPGSGS
jgi:hypothetical protein